MRIGLGLGIGFVRGRGMNAATFALSDGQWFVTERPEDIYTRQLQIDIPVNPPTGRKYVWYRGQNSDGRPTSGSFGAFVSAGGTAWRAQATGKSPLYGFDYVRVFTVPNTVADPVAWNADVTPVSTIKTFAPSGQPLAAEVDYTVDGSGTTALMSFGARAVNEGDGRNGVTPWRAVDQGRWRLYGSTTYTTFSDADTLALTGLSATQDLLFSWHNVNGWGPETGITVVASPPTFASSDWTLTDAVAASGDGLQATISATPAAPAGWSAVGVEYRQNINGAGYGSAVSMPLSGLLTTTALTSTAVQLRMVYDMGVSIWGDTKTVTPTAPVINFPTIVAQKTHRSTANASTHTIPLDAHIPNDLILVVYAPDGAQPISLSAGWQQDAAPVGSSGQHLHWIYKFADTSSETLTVTFTGSEMGSAVIYTIRGARDIVFGTRFTNGTGSTVTPDAPNLDVGTAEKILWVTACAATGTNPPQTAAPSGWSNFNVVGGTDSSATDVAAATLESDVSAVNAPVWPLDVQTVQAMTVAVRPGVRSVAPTLSTATTMTGVAAEGEYLSFTPAIYAGPPDPVATMYVERSNDAGATWATVATITDRSIYHLYLDSGAVGYTYRGRSEATNAAGNGPSSATATTAVVAATSGLLAPQTITRGLITMEVRGLSSYGWTEDGVFVGVPAATNYTIVSATPAEQQVAAENNYWINGHQKNATTAQANPYDQRWRASTTLGLNTTFDLSLMAKFPVRMTGDDVWTKSVCQTDTGYGSRQGSILQWLACTVGTAAPVAKQFGSPAWKFAGRSNNLVTLDVDAYLATLPTYNWIGTDPGSLETEIQRFERFDPSIGRWTATANGGDYERWAPFQPGFNASSGYGLYRAEQNGYLLMHLLGNVATSAQKRRILVAGIGRGIQWDTGIKLPTDGGHMQFHLPWIALVRYLRGQTVSTLETTNPGNWLEQYFQWDSTTMAALAPNGPARTYVYRTVTAVDVSGANPVITYSKSGSGLDASGMMIPGLLVRRVSDGATATALSGGIGHNTTGKTSFNVTIDAMPTEPFAVGDQHYFPNPTVPNVGDPDWSIRGPTEMTSYNGSGAANYRDLNEYMANLMCMTAMGLWPTTGVWSAMREYAERTAAGNYPTAGLWRFSRPQESGWAGDNWDAYWSTIKSRPVLVV